MVDGASGSYRPIDPRKTQLPDKPTIRTEFNLALPHNPVSGQYTISPLSGA
jgi:hypothetical protein